MFGQQPSNPVDVNADGVPDLMEAFQYFGGGTSATVNVHRAIHPDNALLITPSGDAGFEVGASLDENLKAAEYPSVSWHGYYGFRFRAADGLHYGWFHAAQPLLPGGGFWPNFTGVTVRNHGYNMTLGRRWPDDRRGHTAGVGVWQLLNMRERPQPN